MYQIVANAKNCLDVDKYDYLYRDSIHCGFGVGFDVKRIIS